MSDLFWLIDAQMARLEPYFPKSHGKPRVDDSLPGNGLPASRCRSADATNLKVHRTATSMGVKKGGVAAGQVSDYVGARALRSSLPNVDWLLGDRGYDPDWFREALKDKGIRACIPSRKQRKTPVKYDKRRYKRRNRIAIMFGRLKDWRRVATRYDRCPKVFLSAIALSAIVICRL